MGVHDIRTKSTAAMGSCHPSKIVYLLMYTIYGGLRVRQTHGLTVAGSKPASAVISSGPWCEPLEICLQRQKGPGCVRAFFVWRSTTVEPPLSQSSGWTHSWLTRISRLSWDTLARSWMCVARHRAALKLGKLSVPIMSRCRSRCASRPTQLTLAPAMPARRRAAVWLLAEG